MRFAVSGLRGAAKAKAGAVASVNGGVAAVAARRGLAQAAAKGPVIGIVRSCCSPSPPPHNEETKKD